MIKFRGWGVGGGGEGRGVGGVGGGVGGGGRGGEFVQCIDNTCLLFSDTNNIDNGK